MDSKILARIQSIIDEADDMTIATVRPDGFPQATTVSFVNDGLVIYFVADPNSQKARNLAACDKVSLTIDLPYSDWNHIRGLSMGATARRVVERAEKERIGKLMFDKFPQVAQYVPENVDDIAFVRVDPKVVSVLDYSKGFGHTDEVVM